MWSSWWDFLHVGYTGVGTRGQVRKTANSFSNDSSGHLILMRAHTHTHALALTHLLGNTLGHQNTAEAVPSFSHVATVAEVGVFPG